MDEKLPEQKDGEILPRSATLILQHPFGKPVERQEVGGIAGAPVQTEGTLLLFGMTALVPRSFDCCRNSALS
jgi:hypothetical protein